MPGLYKLYVLVVLRADGGTALPGDQKRSALPGSSQRIPSPRYDHIQQHLGGMALHGRLAWNGWQGVRRQAKAKVGKGSIRQTFHHEVLAVLASSWLLAQIVPFFSDLVNVLGSTFTPTIAFMTPMFLYLLLVRVQDRACQSSNWMR